ncbi:MAG: hypothetical protein BM556_00320 [Bacteriovorax sp. MedPE-SWde]|nr:MAG: hypothetical protein BM556_00320 [Bacteriovorax sp. MedPE-SWde]
MFMKKLLSAALLLSSLSSTVLANDGISLGEPGYGGSGCPAGTASATVAPDGQSLSIIFDDYIVEAGGDTRKRLARKNCSIAIPVHVPQGFSVSVIDVDYRGYNMIPRGGKARFSAEYFFAGRRGPKVVKNFRGEMDDEYLVRNKLGLNAAVWSPCGADVNLRVNSSMMVKTNRRKEEVMATVDSADFSSAMVYHLKFKRCGSNDFEDDFDGMF